MAKYLAPLAETSTLLRTLDRLKDRTLDEDEVLVSYDISSLFTEVPLKETVDYIIHQIYGENKLPHLSNKRIFKRLLQRVTQGSIFGNLYKQIDGCGMGNPLSPVIANIFMSKLENDVVTPQAPPFYDQYVDDIFT